MADGPLIEFRTGIGNKLQYASGWLRAATRRGVRVRVIGSAATLSALSQLLWTADREGFLPHAWSGPDSALPGIARTTIWLGGGQVAGPSPGQWLNVGEDVPDDLTGCERVVELVAATDDEKAAGRRRWSAYRRQGVEPRHRESGGEDGGGD